jgi:thymidylate synthase
MNNLDLDYQNLLKDILENGVEKKDRTGTGTLSVFGRQIRHNMKDGFPLLTTKKMAWKTMVVELLWFLRGETNIKFLLDYDCHIWDGDAYKAYKTKYDYDNIDSPLSMGEFITKIKTDNEFAKENGDLGKIYGAQWRSWRVGKGIETTLKNEDGETIYESGSIYIDQIQNLINDLKTNPDSRRLMVTAWNPADLHSAVLPPCHYGFQMYTRELSTVERMEYYAKHFMKENETKTFDELLKVDYTKLNIPKRSISLMWNQRSCDFPLGIPFNIASYGLLLEIIAKEVNMVSDELIGNFGDCHIYLNQIDGVKEQISRTSFELPSIKITERNWYQHEKVKEHLGEKTFSEKILSYRPDCFELIGYQSHSKIKMPLSN